MSWPIRMVEAPTFEVGADGKNGFQRLQVGDAWYAPHLLDPAAAERASQALAPRYFRDWAMKRAPIIVAMPYRRGPGIGAHFCIDGRTWKDGKPGPEGWVVTGEPPLLTVSPSINIEGCYHGFLRDGVLGPDLDG